ncbi:uncharacterized protein LOC131957283 [Physella acuta]|uniref:uncharacterized protein LOC131957283 n=1 Tax=Physella acuta TaxID=109671 RepID=UPI0027DDFF4A|nr:uncharacterized protein LOC131957283 [Physella acuta]XP_059177990.1 uncharacterized protein LOC131957283 [Physella acuta]
MSREHITVSQDPGFIVIKYGDDQEALLNPRCPTHVLVDWIRRICECDGDSILDLVDLEGQVKNLPATSDDYATNYVTGRETYVVIRVEREGENGPNRYISLLNHLEKVNPELLVKLDNLSRPDTKTGKRDRFKKSSVRGPRPAVTKGDNKQQRPTSTERAAKSKQGK